MNFEIIDYTMKEVGAMRFEYPEFYIPEGTPEDDFVARVVGRCLDGPKKGQKAMQIMFVTKEMAGDPRCREIVESDAQRAWSRLE